MFMHRIEKIIIRMIGIKNYGSLEYYFFHNNKNEWGGAFNGQQGRLALFKDIIKRSAPSAIVETGTYLGTTTEAFAETKLPVYTIESNQRNYGFSKSRLRKYPNVNIKSGDSRVELLALFKDPLNVIKDKSIFFYLDAHWKKDLPLAEEIEVIFKNCSMAVVMVDDFKVPMDSGYGFDDYGPGKTLNEEYISPAVETYNLTMSYPSISSADETGMKRGCVILSSMNVYFEKLVKSNLLEKK